MIFDARTTRAGQTAVNNIASNPVAFPPNRLAIAPARTTVPTLKQAPTKRPATINSGGEMRS